MAWLSPRNRAMAWCFRCVLAVFPVCFGVALHDVRADLLRFGHLAHSLRRANTRAGPSPQRAELGRAPEGARASSWTRGCAANAGSKADHEGRPSSSGTKPALKAAAAAECQNPRHHPQSSLPRNPGLDQPSIPPSTLENHPPPRKTNTTNGNTREFMNKHPCLYQCIVFALVLSRSARAARVRSCLRIITRSPQASRYRRARPRTRPIGGIHITADRCMRSASAVSTL